MSSLPKRTTKLLSGRRKDESDLRLQSVSSSASSGGRQRRRRSAEITEDSSDSSLDGNNGIAKGGIVSILERKLSEATSELGEVKERLEDRELEIHILQKRLNLRRSNSKSGNNNNNCGECSKKNSVIEDLCEKMTQLEVTIDELISAESASAPSSENHQSNPTQSDPSPSSQAIDFDLILRNVSDLNGLVNENRHDVQFGGNGARFHKRASITLSLFKEGFHLDNQLRLRPYSEPASRALLKDLTDGFFPAELQGEYPDGVALLPKDRRWQSWKELAADSLLGSRALPFSGHGVRLGSRPASAAISIPRLESPVPSVASSSKSIPNLEKTQRPQKLKLAPLRRPSTSTKSADSTSTSSAPGINGKKNTARKPKAAASKPRVHTLTPFNDMDTTKRDTCRIKVLGIAASAFLLELVNYDTVKTLRGVLENCAAERLGGTVTGVEVVSAWPKRRMEDDARTMAEVGLSPNGVVHVKVLRGAD